MTMMLFLVVLLIILLVSASLLRNIVHGRIDRTPVVSFDLQRYLGTWYEIARFENRFERGLTAVTAHYEPRADGLVKVVNSGTCTKTGERRVSCGRAKTTSLPGRLKVSFFWIFYSEYNVLELSDDYSWALVGSRSAKYLWILSRTPTLAPEIVEDLRLRAQERGYDTEWLLMVDQRGPHE